MQLDQNTEYHQEKCILASVEAIENSLQNLSQSAEASPTMFVDALTYLDTAHETAASYLRDVKKFADKPPSLDMRLLKLVNLSFMTTYLGHAQNNIAQKIDNPELTPFFRAAMKRCNASIVELSAQVEDTVKRGKYTIEFEKARLGSAAKTPAKPQATRPTWMKLVVDNTPVCS